MPKHPERGRELTLEWVAAGRIDAAIELTEMTLDPPEGKDFAPGSDEAWAASPAIDFCVDYVDGRPLRWFAGRKAGAPERTVEATREAGPR